MHVFFTSSAVCCYAYDMYGYASLAYVWYGMFLYVT
jgi:hypothetical protein